MTLKEIGPRKMCLWGQRLGYMVAVNSTKYFACITNLSLVPILECNLSDTISEISFAEIRYNLIQSFKERIV